MVHLQVGGAAKEDLLKGIRTRLMIFTLNLYTLCSIHLCGDGSCML
jgi:hypothetical protein